VASGKWLGSVCWASADYTTLASLKATPMHSWPALNFACGHPGPPSLLARSEGVGWAGGLQSEGGEEIGLLGAGAF
jgi:hypothetical protein